MARLLRTDYVRSFLVGFLAVGLPLIVHTGVLS